MKASCIDHKNKMLRFLLIKTAPVRGKVKPAVLLRVPKCYRLPDGAGNEFCLHQKDMLHELNLDFVVLRQDAECSTILFYDKELLARTLNDTDNMEILVRSGYRFVDNTSSLQHLKRRFAQEKLPHEIGIFLGYPAKDVAPFIAGKRESAVKNGLWLVFGDPTESLRRMELYRRAEEYAAEAVERANDFPGCLAIIDNFKYNIRSMIHA